MNSITQKLEAVLPTVGVENNYWGWLLTHGDVVSIMDTAISISFLYFLAYVRSPGDEKQKGSKSHIPSGIALPGPVLDL